MFVRCQPMNSKDINIIVDFTLIQGIGFLFQDFKKLNLLDPALLFGDFPPEIRLS